MNKNILIGITGSIAAYKAAELISLFKKQGCEVKVVTSKSALLFIGEKTLETLSNNPVYTDMFQKRAETKHVSLADWADIFIIAPVSADTISKIALGLADNLVSSIACAYLGRKKPFFIAPAMNEGMWKNPAVVSNIQTLKNFKAKVIGPVIGSLACGYEGAGRMEEPAVIFEAANSFLHEFNRPDNSFGADISTRGICKKVVVTSGGTREYIDPVRFITNASSGKMGTALADCAYSMGYETVLISTVETKKPYKVILVSTAAEMENAVNAEFQNADYLFMASAVSDFKIKNYKNSKIRKTEIKNGLYTIELSLNPDILKNAAQTKKEWQKIIGFSLADKNPVETAKEKLKDKKCDFIVANEPNTTLNKDTAEVWVIGAGGSTVKMDKAPKTEIARAILEIVL